MPKKCGILSGMSAQAATPIDASFEELLDVDTSAAILRWMETGSIPHGIDVERWAQWLDGGCQESLGRQASA